MKVSASFLTINNIDKIEELDKAGIDYLHLDIMDGIFVSNKTWNYHEIKKLLKNTTSKKDVHLMVKDVEKYIKKFNKLNPDFITFHIEATDNPLRMIELIKRKGIKAGISIKPNTNVDTIISILPYIDLVLVMSVEPGKGGQAFINSSIDKINQLVEIRKQEHYHYLIEVDGGINDDTVQLVDKSDIIVSGSYITNSDNYKGQIDKLKR